MTRAGGLALAAALAERSTAAAVPDKGEARPPNIVLVLADDLGYGELGCYDSPVLRTPNLDRMASEGVRFTQYYAGAPVCAPSRATLLTGLHTGHARIRQNPEPGMPDQPLRPEDTTLAEVLESAGYATGLFGKWGFCPERAQHFSHPNNKGFGTYFGLNSHAAAHEYYPAEVWDNDHVHRIAGNENGGQRVYAPDLFQERALAFLEAHRHEPFFAMLSTQLPHSPQQVPEIDPVYREREDLSEDAKKHCSQVSHADRQLGAVLDKLRELDLEEHTLVLFASDNGPTEEPSLDPDSYRAGGGLRGYKRNLYEGGVRVPLIAWGPGRTRGGASDEVLASWDLLPTLAALAGAAVPGGLDGTALPDTLLGRPRAERHAPLYFYRNDPYTTPGQSTEDGAFGSCAAEAVRQGDWKAVRFAPDRSRDHPDSAWHFELYDLASDPSERTEVSARHPGVAAELLATMKRSWSVPEPAPEPAAAP